MACVIGLVGCVRDGRDTLMPSGLSGASVTCGTCGTQKRGVCVCSVYTLESGT